MAGPKAWECRLYGYSCGKYDCGGALFIGGTIRWLREKLHDFPGEDVVTMFGDIGRFDEAERIREVLLVRVGRLDAVAASLGQGCHGPSWVGASFEMRKRAIGDHLTPQCVIAHTFLPLMIAQGYAATQWSNEPQRSALYSKPFSAPLLEPFTICWFVFFRKSLPTRTGASTSHSCVQI